MAVATVAKTCSECGETKSDTEYSQRQSKCKPCQKTYRDAWWLRNAEARNERMRNRTAEEREADNTRRRRLYAESEERRRQYSEWAKKWRAENAEYKAEWDKAYYEEHRDHLRALNKAWIERNPDVVRRLGAQSAATRRARMRNVAVERIDRAEIIVRDGARCHFCRKKLNPQKVHLDHLIPLSWDESEHTARNLAVACPECNLRNAAGRLPAQLRLIG